jgi:hypothetical protein
MLIKRYFFCAILGIFVIIAMGCPGIGKLDKQAAEKAINQIKETYGDKVTDVKVYRDKLQIAMSKNIANPEKAQIFMDAATFWWAAYPNGKKPKYKLYCWAYDDVIADDNEIGSLNIKRGIRDEQPAVEGQPGIYALRDVK